MRILSLTQLRCPANQGEIAHIAAVIGVEDHRSLDPTEIFAVGKAEAVPHTGLPLFVLLQKRLSGKCFHKRLAVLRVYALQHKLQECIHNSMPGCVRWRRS